MAKIVVACRRRCTRVAVSRQDVGEFFVKPGSLNNARALARTKSWLR